MTDEQVLHDAVCTVIHQMVDVTVQVNDINAARDYVVLREGVESIVTTKDGFEFMPWGQFGTTGSGKVVKVWQKPEKF